MKNSLVVLCVCLLAFGPMLVIGCGGGGEKGDSVVVLDGSVEEGIIGGFIEGTGEPSMGAGSIVFLKGEGFEGNAWGPEKSGTYVIEKSPDGRDVAVLSFGDSGATETWTITVSNGRVAAVTSPKGIQYTKVEAAENGK